MNTKKHAAPGIGFSDAEFKSFQLNGDFLIIFLNSWDEKEIKMTFFNPIHFTYKSGDIIADFFEIQENTNLLKEVLSREYQKVPLEHPFKLFQIVDVGGFPFIEIVAESVNVTK